MRLVNIKERIWEKLKGKKILILGFGREGRSTYEFLREMDSEMEIGVADLREVEELKRDVKVRGFYGADYLEAAREYDVIMKGPGVIVKDALPEEVLMRMTGQTDLLIGAAREVLTSGKVIGITGTKGKSTTTSLLTRILQEAGRKVVFVGNIGVPCFEHLDEIDEDTDVVLELSSHQLEFAHNSPEIGVILNIYEEHLDHYLSLAHYQEAKKNLVRFQKAGDFALLGPGVEAETAGTVVRLDELPLAEVETQLKGEHNRFNITVCLEIAKILGVSREVALKAVAEFKGLPHRMEFVGEFSGVKYYDDSIATSVPSVLAAIETLGDVDTLIAGGMDRGLNYAPLVEALGRSTVRNVILLPETGERILRLFETGADGIGLVQMDMLAEPKNVRLVKDMAEAVTLAKKVTTKGKSCLMSPAAASYNTYRNFEERGDDFQRLVKL